MGVELPLCVVVTILECCVTFSGVKLSIRSFVLFGEKCKHRLGPFETPCLRGAQQPKITSEFRNLLYFYSYISISTYIYHHKKFSEDTSSFQ